MYLLYLADCCFAITNIKAAVFQKDTAYEQSDIRSCAGLKIEFSIDSELFADIVA